VTSVYYTSTTKVL